MRGRPDSGMIFGMTPSGRRTVRTMCPMNCHPTLCGMLVDVEDGRLTGVRGDPDNPDSRGFLCIRGQSSREIIDNPRRLLRPLVRTRRGSDDWREASWDEALDLVAARMRAAGGEKVGVWTGHGLAATNYGTRLSGALALPMLSRGRLLGILVLGERAGGEAYAPDEVEALSQFARGVGSSLDALAGADADSIHALRETIARAVATLDATMRSLPESIASRLQARS